MKNKNIIEHNNCDGNENFIRTGNLICKDCGKKYSEHPYCSNSKFKDNYYLYVLCDGTHIKL